MAGVLCFTIPIYSLRKEARMKFGITVQFFFSNLKFSFFIIYYFLGKWLEWLWRCFGNILLWLLHTDSIISWSWISKGQLRSTHIKPTYGSRSASDEWSKGSWLSGIISQMLMENGSIMSLKLAWALFCFSSWSQHLSSWDHL